MDHFQEHASCPKLIDLCIYSIIFTVNTGDREMNKTSMVPPS